MKTYDQTELKLHSFGERRRKESGYKHNPSLSLSFTIHELWGIEQAINPSKSHFAHF
jgi:hypothetical protein